MHTYVFTDVLRICVYVCDARSRDSFFMYGIFTPKEQREREREKKKILKCKYNIKYDFV